MAYEYRYDPEDFDPVSDVKAINTDLQEDIDLLAVQFIPQKPTMNHTLR